MQWPSAGRVRGAWEQSVAAARQLGMPYDEARAHFELGRHRPSTDPLRRQHLLQARDLFTPLQAGHELSRTESLLADVEVDQ